MNKADAIRRLKQVARAEVGVREIGTSNTGRRVEEYQATTTLGGTGWPWCAAFVNWCLVRALGQTVARQAWIPTASCDAILGFARRNGILHDTPVDGCVFLVMASKNDAVHTGFVTGVEKSTFGTIEGNTNDGGSRNGNGVYARTRKMSGIYKFVYWQNLLPNTDEWIIKSSAGREMGKFQAINGRVHIPARTWGTWFGLATGWDNDRQQVTFNEKPVKSQIRLIDGTAWLPIRALADVSDLTLAVDSEKRKIRLERN